MLRINLLKFFGTADEIAERRAIIKNKILAVGKMSRVFAVLREESEAVSELKSVTGTPKLPAGTLANGAEGIKEGIGSFGDARKSDIENERLPPDLYDPADVEGMESFAPEPQSPGGSSMSGIIDSPSTGIQTSGLSRSDSMGLSSSGPSSPETPARRRMSSPGSPTMGSPSSPVSPSSAPFRRGHSRQQSLGTTMTSPSTRRRSLEGTLQMIRQAMDAKDAVIENLADEVAAGTAEDSGAIPGSPARRQSISKH